MSTKRLYFPALALLFPLLLTACGSPPQVTPTITPTSYPTYTSVPTSTKTPEPTPTPIVISGTITLYSISEEGSSIFQIKPDGTNLIKIFDVPKGASSITWSPDKSKIMYLIEQGEGYYQIYGMDADGTNQLQLTENKSRYWWIAWSPDGERILFTSDNPMPPRINVINADGTNQTELVNRGEEFYYNEYSGQWSPDGKQIVYHGLFYNEETDTASQDIWLFNLENSVLFRLSDTSRPIENLFPTWSPDGNLIAFQSNQIDSNIENCGWRDEQDKCLQVIYITSPENGEPYLLSEIGSYDNIRLKWSAEGSRIAFTSNINDPNAVSCDWGECVFDLFIVDTNGSNLKQLTQNTEKGNVSFAWSPDGMYLVVSIRGEGLAKLLVISIEGKILSENTYEMDIYPVHWMP